MTTKSANGTVPTVSMSDNAPKGKRQERTRESEQGDGKGCAKNPEQKDGFAPNVIRKTVPLQNGYGLGSEIQGHL